LPEASSAAHAQAEALVNEFNPNMINGR